ncbi:cyclic nucleotide-binding domain-containing protein [Mesorhizobium sp.]|uniref:cyclic nucleotide-binding domain-containing protein n=1 Tax=Mesorhizobium sp. TaxID=1871066 RepID=UPI000FE79F63|nr:cyclic nucleotide-binding domain-containing protein [Mesorhizobium sp.]RWM06791.1 MAG: cyclic nucleotide-binding domain-containing protein [Mesorhizobium sp.]RWM25039.1 MAG: cyclic nucleotide-binding domain-containing protein [Mesorhizobium sp.]RWM33505.1 MAG: cyclic nucleotide-binding domain-containing protein [Mesorhizobium sp.]TIO51085.1 MAG: cyclic nucleotide-binding domain-containing protein [Mesorhizobium sp.]TIO60130.1 MAG: cyclic nucleotide-binding domain-containing protein [Mesorhi
MLLKDEVGTLQRVPLFSGIEPTKLKLLAFTSDRVSYSSGQILFRQGDEGDAAYVILSGTADILVDSDSGPIKVAELVPNSIVGEIAILCNSNRTATVRAASPLEALRIRKDHFLRLMNEFPEMTIEILRVLADRLSHTTADLIDARSAK